MSTPLVDKVALVTGGSRGIGAAVCQALAEVGATVAINYVQNAELAAELAERLGNDATTWQADVGDPAQVAKMVTGVLERHGRLDILVVNAGVWRGGLIEDISNDDWRAVIDTSLTGAFLLARASSPALRQSSGRIIVMSSVIGLIGYAGDTAYAAAKAGLVGLVRSLAKELGHDGVLVNAVAPGLIDTDMTADVPHRSRDRMIDRTALGRAGTTAEVAAATTFLASSAGYITGHVLVVDGGLSL